MAGAGGRGLRAGDEPTFETSKGVDVVTTFDAMGIKQDLLRGLYAYGFEKPSAIQQRAVLPITQGRDVIAQAQSGTGKTSMIALSLCQMVDVNTRECAPRPSARPPPPHAHARLHGARARRRLSPRARGQPLTRGGVRGATRACAQGAGAGAVAYT